ncbi:sulfotransferase family protein [Marinomonas sp. NPDC078689]|uniref:sulfotransferase family protein n=1 Tax=Marinomonas sp. NPDC078689 TaxID=3364147 RepID=UPI0037C6C4ED
MNPNLSGFMKIKCILKNALKKVRNKYLFNKKAKQIAAWKDQSPIFILGTQKTGTTAIAALLAKSCNEEVTLDLLKSIKDPAWLLRVSYGLQPFSDIVAKYEKDFSKKMIKEPWLTYFYEDLVTLYPKAKFVMVVRDPFSTIRSVLNRLQIPGDKARIDQDAYTDLTNIKIWKLALDSSWSGRPSEDYITAMAHRWDIASRVYLDNQDRFHLIRYEDFNADKQAAIAALSTALGYHSHGDIEPYLDIQYQVKGKRDTDLKAFFGDENYQKIARICGDSAAQLGYTI